MCLSSELVTGSRPTCFVTAKTGLTGPHTEALFRHQEILGLLRAAELPEGSYNLAWDPQDIFIAVAEGDGSRIVGSDEVLYDAPPRIGRRLSTPVRQAALAAIAECALTSAPSPAFARFGRNIGLDDGDRVLVVQMRESLGILPEDVDLSCCSPGRLRLSGGLMLATRPTTAHARIALGRRLDPDHDALTRIALFFHPDLADYVRLGPPALPDTP